MPDPAATAELTAALAGFWTVEGENTRVIAITAAVDDALAGWQPEPDEIDVAVTAAAITAMNTMVGEIADAAVCLAILEKYGDRTSEPRARGMVEVLAAQDADDPTRTLAAAAQIDVGARLRPRVRRDGAALAAHYLENDGDPERALRRSSAGLALVEDSDGPWIGR